MKNVLESLAEALESEMSTPRKTWSVLFQGCPWTSGRGKNRTEAIEDARENLEEMLPVSGHDVPTEWNVVDAYEDRPWLFWVH